MRAIMIAVSVLIPLCSVLLASAKTINVVVGGNGTNPDASLIFQPQEIRAAVGDVVIFNFTNGTHTAIQSTFAEPCIPAHVSNTTINGFDSGLRDTVNGTVQTTLTLTIQPADQNTTFWFYDLWGCGYGGVGAINANDSDWQNFAAFVRNAKRLNGPKPSSSSSRPSSSSSFGFNSSLSRTSTRVSIPTATTTTSSAERVGANAVKMIFMLAPILLAMLVV